MTYQDKWRKGQLISKGYRDCEPRYQIVREFCSQFCGPFSVLDIGANMCYFGLRLTEDFPLCSVIAFEFHQFAMRKAHVDSCKQTRLMFLERKLSLDDLAALSSCAHFDVVLALSVIHHLPGNSKDWTLAFLRVGDNVLIEYAGDDSKRLARKGYQVLPPGGAVLGYGMSHLKPGFQRPIVLLQGEGNGRKEEQEGNSGRYACPQERGYGSRDQRATEVE